MLGNKNSHLLTIKQERYIMMISYIMTIIVRKIKYILYFIPCINIDNVTLKLYVQISAFYSLQKPLHAQQLNINTKNKPR